MKASTSRRRIPLHAKVIKLGVLDYVATVKHGVPLWPKLTPGATASRTQLWSKWWGRYADSCKVADPRKTFHSFRHSFKVACRAAGISEEVHDILTGHAGGGVGRSYGSGVDYPLEPLAEAFRKLKLPGFPL